MTGTQGNVTTLGYNTLDVNHQAGCATGKNTTPSRWSAGLFGT